MRQLSIGQMLALLYLNFWVIPRLMEQNNKKNALASQIFMKLSASLSQEPDFPETWEGRCTRGCSSKNGITDDSYGVFLVMSQPVYCRSWTEMFLKWPKKIKSFRSECLKIWLMNAVTVSFKTTARRMTEVSQSGTGLFGHDISVINNYHIRLFEWL